MAKLISVLLLAGAVLLALDLYWEARPGRATAAGEAGDGLVGSAAAEGDSFRAALALAQGGDHAEAILEFNRAVAAEPTRSRIYVARAESFLQLEKFAEALSDLEKAVGLKPDDPLLLTRRARSYRHFGRFDAAMADLNRALELEADLVEALFARGATYFQRSEFEKALRDFDRCVELDGTLGAAFFNRAMTHQQLGDLTEARKDINRFLDTTDDEDLKEQAQALLRRWKTKG